MRRVCSVSIDVDPLPCYYRIHGLGPAPAELRDVVMRRGAVRFAEALAERGIRATFFVVAEDLDVDVVGKSAHSCRSIVEELAAAGHEIASHSYSHPYDLARQDALAAATEIRRAHELLSGDGRRVVRGFRAPGYDLSSFMLEELVRLGYRYDSSLFPAPGYYAAKAVVMAGLAVAGRPSGAVMTNPRALLAPADPYRPDLAAPWRRGLAPIVELPVAVTPYARTPAIGTNLLLAPRLLRDHWLRSMRGRWFFNFELHGIDLCDAEEDGIPGRLVARQPDLRKSVAHKRQALLQVLDHLSTHFELVTLDEAAALAARSV